MSILSQYNPIKYDPRPAIAAMNERSPYYFEKYQPVIENPILIKATRPEFNIAKPDNVKTIQLGTTAYYRDFDETDYIGDKNDGIAHYNINQLHSEDHVIIIGMSAKNPGPNSYVFCCTKHNPSNQDKIFKEYDDKYFINRINTFGEILIELLTLHIVENNLLNHIPRNKLKVSAMVAVVLYKQEFDVSNIKLEPHILIQNANFRKHPRYKHQQEVRFIFNINEDHGDGIVTVHSVPKEPIVVDLTKRWGDLSKIIGLEPNTFIK